MYVCYYTYPGTHTPTAAVAPPATPNYAATPHHALTAPSPLQVPVNEPLLLQAPAVTPHHIPITLSRKVSSPIQQPYQPPISTYFGSVSIELINPCTRFTFVRIYVFRNNLFIFGGNCKGGSKFCAINCDMPGVDVFISPLYLTGHVFRIF